MATKLVYPALLELSIGNIGVTFPDLPGCVTVGKDVSEALANAREALMFHLEGMLEDGQEFPAASDPSGIKRDGEALAVVEVFSPEKLERVNITLSAADLARIDKNAEEANMTRSAYIVKRATSSESARATRKLPRKSSGKAVHRSAARRAKRKERA